MKKVFFLFLTTILFSLCAQAVFGDTWTWIGGSSGDWAYGPPWRNETTGEDGGLFSDHPYNHGGREDTVYISGDCAIGLKYLATHYNIAVKELRVQNYTGAADKTSSWTATLNGNKTLTFDLMEFDRASSAPGVTGTLVFNCDAVCNSEIITHSDTTYTANKKLTLAADSKITAYGNGVMTINTLSGGKTATLMCDSDDGITISGYGTGSDAPLIAIKANSKRVQLAGGTVAALTVNSNSSAIVASDMTVEGDLVVDGDLTISGDLTVKGKLTVTGSGKLTVTGALDVTGTTSNAGTISTSAGDITFGGAVTGAAGTITTTSGNITCAASAALGEVKTTSGTLQNTGSGAVTVSEFTMNGSAAIENASSGSLTITTATANANASVTNSGSGALKVTTFTCAKDGANISLSGNNTFGALSVKSGGGTLTVDGAQTINGAMTLQGKSGNTLTVTGSASGKLNIASSQESGDYITVARNTVAIGNGKSYAASHSAFNSAPLNSIHNNWILLNGPLEFVWTGLEDSAWSNPKNWNHELVPGLPESGGIFSTQGYPVKIPKKPNQPIVSDTESYSVGELTIEEADAILTLSGSGAVATNGTLANKGTIVYSGTGRITDGTNFINDASTTNQGTVEFGGTSGATDLSEVSYYNLTINGSGNFEASGAVTTSGNLDIESGALVTSGALTVTGTTTNKGAITATDANNITFNGKVDGATGTITTSTGSVTTKAADPSNLGAVTSSGGTLTNSGSGAVTATKFTMDANSSITNSAAGSITIGELDGAHKATIHSATVANGVTISAYGATNVPSITIKANSKNISLVGGTISALELRNQSTATIEGGLTVSGATSVAGDNVKFIVNGTNTFASISITSGDGTLTVNGAQTISGAMTLKGKLDHPLNITGTASGALNIASNQSSGQYLKVDRDCVSIGNEKYYKASYSTYNTSDEEKKYGRHQNWILLNTAMKFIWTGNKDQKWKEPLNWKCNLIPGTHHGTGDSSDDIDTRNVSVEIPDAPEGGRFPIAIAGYTLSNLTVGGSSHLATLTVNAAGDYAHDGNHIKVSGDFYNYGRIIYKNTGRISNQSATPFAYTNDAENGGTVEFQFPPEDNPLIDFASVPYWNLEITGSGTYTANAALTVNNALTVSGESTPSAGSVYFNNSAAATATSAKTVRFNTSGTISLGNTAGDSFTVKEGALGLPAASDTLGGLELAGTITLEEAGKKITLGHNAKLNANTTFASDAELTAPVIVSTNPAASASVFTLTTNGALTTSSTNKLTLQNASLTNTGAVTNGNIEFTGTSDQTFTPHETSTYDTVAINKASGGSVTVGKEMSAKNLAIKQAADKNATFDGKVTVSDSFSDTDNVGNILFNAGCAFTPATTFATTGTVTLNGATTACDFTNGVTHTAGDTELYGALNATDKSVTLGTTKLAADTTINAGTGTVALGALDGAFDFASAGSGTLTFKGSVGSAAALKTITVAKETVVEENAAFIKTFGLQQYNDSITFKRGCAVDGPVQAAANIATSGAFTVTFTKDVNLITTNPATLGGNGGKLLISGDLYFEVSGKTSTIASTVQAKDILLFQGEISVSLGGELKSTKDTIFLGSNYSIADTSAAEPSQVTDLFAYNHASRGDTRHSPAQYTKAFPAAPYSGKVTTAAGAKVTVGKNFYANGLDNLGSGSWTLTIPNNDLQTAAFAEIYNSTITNCSANYKVAAAENTTAPGCTNIITTRPEIDIAYTVYDDVIYVSFKDSAGNKILPTSQVKIENSNNEIFIAASKIFYSDANFAGTYTDADCQIPTTGKGDLDSFYIKASGKWNTDATGTSEGASESTDRSGAHQGAKPCINLPKALDGLYETLRDSAKNRIRDYSSAHGKTFTNVADKCAPVLVQVLTGQELHKAPGSQEPYDAHNFIEFVYSEPVDISGGVTSVADSDKNIQAAADLGATQNTASGVTFKGLATIASGKIDAALKTGSGSPHALYRNFATKADGAGDYTASDQAARIRVSIAGWADGAFDAQNQNWPGYISSAKTPSDTVTPIDNTNIKDRSPAKNSLDADTAKPGHPLPSLTVNTSPSELYGPWDTTPPSFAPVRINGARDWSRPATDGSEEFEFVGASYGTGTLSAIEAHWFDNEPSYSGAENPQWFSRVGWGSASSSTEYSTVASYAADILGGSRPGESSNSTKGGIRYCSLRDANGAFKYAVDGTDSWYDFTKPIQAGAESSLFAYAGDSSGLPTHATGAEDGLYCKLILDQTSYVLQTTFALTFDSDKCFVTDLAGNRIQCGKIKMKSIDRTPPAFNMSAVPLGTKNMLVIFSKALNTNQLLLYTDATHSQTVSALEYISKGLELTDSSGTGIAIDQSVPAQCLFKTKNSTGILLTLNQNAVLTDITSGVFVTAKSAGTSYDPLAGVTASITYIQDAIGNYVVANSKHAFSDFAVNAVQPQYAYDNSLTDEGVPVGFGLYQDGSWAVRDWNAEQANYGTLHAQKEIFMQTILYDGTSDKSGGLLPNGRLPSATTPGASGTVTGFFANHPDAASVSAKINETTGKSWRIWQPNFTSDIFQSLAPANNTSYIHIDDPTYNDAGVLFDIPKDKASAWKSGDQISFVFKLDDYTVDHFADGTAEPLYAVRLKNPNDITSLDLWSFKVKDTTLQRGGVTILNNVINVDNGENTVVQVDMKEPGNLNVIVMTLDGNIVKYLRHGYTDMGTHYYNWNGTNNGGSKVARGLYFVRVIGPGIDETRKVMCVK